MNVKKKQVKKEPKEESLKGLQKAVAQINLAKQGKVHLKSAEQLLKEL